jgi:uncharacterized membrane protein YbhN (UPF0104 family)
MTADSTRHSNFAVSVVKRSVKPILIAIVVIGIVQAVRLAYLDLQRTHEKAAARIAQLETASAHAKEAEKNAIEREISSIQDSLFSFSKVQWPYFLAAVPLACISILPTGIYWWLTFRQFGHRVPCRPTLAAYSSGGLGKYVPGKAMVLILRSGAMQTWGVPITTSILSIFIETLMALAAAGGLGTACLTSLSIPTWLRTTLVATAFLSIMPILPPVFRLSMGLLTRWKHLRLPPEISTTITWRFVLVGWLLSLLGQLFAGLTLWCVCLAVNSSMPIESLSLNSALGSTQLLFVCMAATSMGFVIGFLSMLPGGAGARELVVTLVLAPAIGYAPALAAAVFFRIASLIGDLSAAGITSLLSPSKRIAEMGPDAPIA